MIQGQTLDAVWCDALEAQVTPTTEDQISAYVGLSRIKTLLTVRVLQPFSPWLFSRGPPPGPHLLMEKLRGKLSVEEALVAYDKALEVNGDSDDDGKKTRARWDPMKQTYRCMHCFLTGRACLKEPKAFGVRKPSELLYKLFMDGGWARCEDCKRSLGRTTNVELPVKTAATVADEEMREHAMAVAEAEKRAGEACECTVCKQDKYEEDFDPSVWHNRIMQHRRCLACQACSECGGRSRAPGV